MGKLVLTEFVTLDGVMEAPGGEASLGDRAGWTMPFFNDEAGMLKFQELQASDALLLGRKTYEGFAAAWPLAKDTGEFGEKMNSMPKFVVSSTLDNPEWTNTTVLKGDLAQSVRTLKQQIARDILLSGSIQLSQSLIELGLIDEYRLLVFPIILGAGRRLFKDSGALAPLQLIDSKSTSKGVLILTYVPPADTAGLMPPGARA